VKAAAAAGLLLALAPAIAGAHPLDEVVQGAYLTLAPGELRLELDITPGTQVSASVLTALDANADHQITDAEARAYGRLVLSQSSLTLDGAPAVWRLQGVAAPPYDHILAEAQTLKIYAVAARPNRAGPRALAFENRYAPAKTQAVANIFLQPAGGWRYAVTAQQHSDDGRRLSVAYTVAR
jgi:hypothetical protein